MRAVISFILVFTSISAQAQIPLHANRIDGKGKRQGPWTILFDSDSTIIKDTARAYFYREITYRKDEPVGLTQEYFKNGKPKFKGTILQDKPTVVYDGVVIWYQEDGSRKELEFQNGTNKGSPSFFYSDGKPITDSWQVLNDAGFDLYKKHKTSEALLYTEKARTKAAFEFGKKSASYATSLNNLALIYADAGNYALAAPLCIEARNVRASVLGKEHADYALSSSNLGDLYVAMDEYLKAEPYYIEAKEIRAKVFGTDHPDYATSLSNLATLYQAIENFDKAEQLFLETKEIKARALGKNNPDYAAALDNLANLYVDKGEYSKAEPLYIESKEIKEKTLGVENADYATTLNYLGELYESTGVYSKAEDYYLKATSIREKVLGKEHPDYINSLNNLALLYWRKSNYMKAEKLWLQVRDLNVKTVGKEHPNYATSLNNLAVVNMEMGNYSKAEPFYLEALTRNEKVLGKQEPRYAQALNNLANLYNRMGNFSKAEPLYLQASETYAKALGNEHPVYALSLNNLANFYWVMGNYAKAETLYIKSTGIREKTLGKDHPDYATSLNNLAHLYQDMGDYAKAEPLFLQSKEIRAKALGLNHPDYATSLNNLARLYQDMGNYSKTESLFIEAKGIREKAFGPQHPEFANSLNNLAIYYQLIKNYAQAEPLFLKAREIQSKALGTEHPNYSLSLNNLASLYQEMNMPVKAEHYYLESIAKKKQQLVRYFPSLSEKEKQAYYASNKFYFSRFEEFCIDRYPQNQLILIDLYNLRLSTKGLLLSAANKMRERILKSRDQNLIDLFNNWNEKTNFLSKAYHMPAEEKLKNRIDEAKLEEEANAMEKELNLKSEIFRKVKEKKYFTWRDVQRQLNPKEAAIEIIRSRKKINKSFSTVYAALIITQGMHHPEIVVLENGDDLENKFMRYYRNAVTQKVKDIYSYQQFWKPIARKLTRIKKVYFSGDGVYNQINLNSLFDVEKGQFLIEQIDIQVVSSTKDLGLVKETLKADIKEAALFGFPDYNHVSLSTDKNVSKAEISKAGSKKHDSLQRFFHGEDISELPGTKKEVESIHALLAKKNVALQEYLFEKATENEIKKLHSPQVLHIATHGFFLSDLPASRENERGFAGMETKKIIENPLLRSGLLFAGAKGAFDETNKDIVTEEDGVLTSYEAMNLDLDSTDLVVMSACETGAGVISTGEGVYGLQRAFQVAGAKSILMSLWSVSDEATQELMILFYEKWLKGKTIREAFREAQLDLKTKFSDPYYWGAFVLVGR